MPLKIISLILIALLNIVNGGDRKAYKKGGKAK